MKCYLLLIKGSFKEWYQLSESRRQEAVAQFGSFAKELGALGYMRGGDGCGERSFRILSPEQTSEQCLVPSSTKDMVTGYFLIEVPSEEEAIKMAKMCPAFSCGEYVELVPCSDV